MVFGEAVPTWRQEQHDRTPTKIASALEFPSYSHYAERLARQKLVPIFKVLVLSGRDTNHAELWPTRREASASFAQRSDYLQVVNQQCSFSPEWSKGGLGDDNIAWWRSHWRGKRAINRTVALHCSGRVNLVERLISIAACCYAHNC